MINFFLSKLNFLTALETLIFIGEYVKVTPYYFLHLMKSEAIKASSTPIVKLSPIGKIAKSSLGQSLGINFIS